VKPERDQRLSDHVALGVLTRTFPPELVDEVLAATGRVQQRSRLLPARLVVYYVLAMALFAQASYEEVMRSLVEGLSWASGWRRAWTVPTKAAIFRARARLGAEPLVQLFARGCVPLATEATPGSFYRGRRLVAVDGTCVDVADTPANAAAFGRPGTQRGEGVGAFPQVRLVAVAECGTHAITAAAVGPVTSGEQTLAGGLLVRSLGPGVLCLADRGFTTHPLLSAAAATGRTFCGGLGPTRCCRCWPATTTGRSPLRSSPPATSAPAPTCWRSVSSSTPWTTPAARRPAGWSTGW
jgi:hypothetical protein